MTNFRNVIVGLAITSSFHSSSGEQIKEPKKPKLYDRRVPQFETNGHFDLEKHNEIPDHEPRKCGVTEIVRKAEEITNLEKKMAHKAGGFGWGGIYNFGAYPKDQVGAKQIPVTPVLATYNSTHRTIVDTACGPFVYNMFFHNHTHTQTFGIVTHIESALTVVQSPGTDNNKRDSNVNFEIMHVSCFGIPGRVHKGWCFEFNNVREQLESTLAKMRQQNLIKKLVFFGHSQGASVATIQAAYFVKRGFKVDALITHGSPRVGNGAFAQYIEDNIPVRKRYTAVSHIGQVDIYCRFPQADPINLNLGANFREIVEYFGFKRLGNLIGKLNRKISHRADLSRMIGFMDYRQIGTPTLIHTDKNIITDGMGLHMATKDGGYLNYYTEDYDLDRLLNSDCVNAINKRRQEEMAVSPRKPNNWVRDKWSSGSSFVIDKVVSVVSTPVGPVLGVWHAGKFVIKKVKGQEAYFFPEEKGAVKTYSDVFPDELIDFSFIGTNVQDFDSDTSSESDVSSVMDMNVNNTTSEPEPEPTNTVKVEQLHVEPKSAPSLANTITTFSVLYTLVVNLAAQTI
eukprot:Pgem_evm1s184